MTTEDQIDYLSAPIDETSAQRLAESGLRFDLVDKADRAQFAAWSQAVSRGFLEAADTDEKLDQRRGYFGARRMSGVWDDSGADPATPVGTIDVWPAALTVPGVRDVPAWAISAVSVAASHRRRGIARALLESELRTARSLGFPVAMLTVSESTIYGRYGFAPSALARDLTIDTARASWIGPSATGRVHFVTREQLQVDGYALVERMRLATPGQIDYGGVLWDRQLGLMAGDEKAASLRFARYDDADGVHQGFAIFRLEENEQNFSNHELQVLYLVTATDDAYAGLWRFLLEYDLVSTITAHLRAVDEPLRLMVADYRAIRTSDYDHLWTRILDVPAALAARRFSAEGRLVIEVTDPLGFAEGTWAIDADATGTARVTSVSGQASDAPIPDAVMSANELAALYLGGVAAATLRRAGRLTGDAEKVDSFFRSADAPWLSIWF